MRESILDKESGWYCSALGVVELGHAMKAQVLFFIGLAMGTAGFGAASGGASRGPAEARRGQSGGTLDENAAKSSPQKDAATASVPPATRGKKLVLKDGNFQLVRSYERNGQKVRYLSAERGDWEEIPAAMVDWEATAKAAAADESANSELVKNVHRQEAEKQAQVPLDVGAGRHRFLRDNRILRQQGCHQLPDR